VPDLGRPVAFDLAFALALLALEILEVLLIKRRAEVAAEVAAVMCLRHSGPGRARDFHEYEHAQTWGPAWTRWLSCFILHA